MQFKSITALAVLLLVVAISASGCLGGGGNDVGPAATATPTTVPIVAKATATPNNTDKGLQVVYAKPVSNVPKPSALGTMKPGNVYVAFNCSVKNLNANDTVVWPDNFRLRDNAGNVYDGILNVYGTSPDVKVFDANSHSIPGDITKGYVFFEVPSDHGAWKSLTYQGRGANYETAVITIPL
jgi:hypothetical protein